MTSCSLKNNLIAVNWNSMDVHFHNIMQSQKVVAAYFSSEQWLPFGFVE